MILLRFYYDVQRCLLLLYDDIIMIFKKKQYKILQDFIVYSLHTYLDFNAILL